MPITLNVGRSLSGAGLSVGGTVQTVTSDVAQEVSVAVPAASVAYEIDLAVVTMSTVQAIGIESSQNVTVRTNSNGTPGDTLTLLANVPKTYIVSSDPAGSKFVTTTTLSKFFVDNAATSAATITFIIGYTRI